jgi:hypothetical protein
MILLVPENKYRALYSGRHNITVTDFRCPKCEAHNFFEKSPRGWGRAGGKLALMNNLEKKSNHPEAISDIGTN